MSERGAGGFLLGIAVGIVLGTLFAPGTGQQTRARLARRLKDIRELAGDKADELKELVESVGEQIDEEMTEAEEDDTEENGRPDLERRLSAARERRRNRKRRGSSTDQPDEEDEPTT